jgi:hypothetical protein
MEIRTAHASDLQQIAAIVRPIVAAGESYAHPDELGDDDISRMWFEPPPGHTIVAVADGNVGGTAKMGPNRTGRGDHIGTASFMVDPESRVRAVRLWQSLGFEIVGTVPGAFRSRSHGRVGLHIMYLTLAG